ncbi:MAG: YdcF family protein [Clostridia bacterium]|nr:YdcF family protein [Clostridia bacterium]
MMCKKPIKIIARILLMLLLFMGVVAFVAPVAVNVINVGNIVGLLLCLLLMAVVLFFEKLSSLLKRWWKKKLGRVLLSIAAVIGSLLVVLAILLTALMVGGALKKPVGDPTVIVLGCAVNYDHPSAMLASRLDTAYDYLVEHPDAVAVLAGGHDPQDAISEAECMYRYLTEKGIAAERLYKEERSTSTYENLLFAEEIIAEHGLNRDLLLVTNEFHEYRAIHIAGKLGFEAYALPAPSKWGLLPTYYVRELLAIVREWFIVGL